MSMKDFFVSYNGKDKEWAEWIAWQLEEAGYTTAIQAWDFRPGSNFIIDMQLATVQSQRTIAVLSQDYLDATYTHPEWAAAFAQDPTGTQKMLLPVRVEECNLKGMLSQIVYIDLVNKSEDEARETLLAGLDTGRAKPTTAPRFPSSSKDMTVQMHSEKPIFPPDRVRSRIKIIEQGTISSPLIFETTERFITIGRSPKNSVQIPNKQVSWEHGQIILMQGGYYYRHQSKSNPSILRRKGEEYLLEAKGFEEIELRNQDRLTIGDRTFIVEFDLINEDRGYITTAKGPDGAE